MRKLIRIAGIAAGVLVALLVIAVLGLNLYVQSLGTQATIEQELSHRLGVPVRIKAISVTPWNGLTLSGITVAQNASPEAGDFLSAQRFELHAGLISLVSGSLVIKKVALVSPKIIWSQNEEGKWRLPGTHKNKKGKPPPAEKIEEPEPPAVSPEPSSTIVAAAPAASEPSTSTPATSSPSVHPARSSSVLVPDVQRVTMSDGDFRFLNRSGNLVAAFEGVDLRATVLSSFSLRGGVQVARVSARDRFYLEKLQSPLHYDHRELDLPQITARAAGGELDGAFQMQPQALDSPFKLSLKFHDLQADQIVTDAGGPHGMIQGKLEGNLEASGSTSDENDISGTGQLVLHDGQVQQYSLLVALGQVLQIEELTQLHLEQAEAKYHVTPGLITIDEIVLRSPNIHLSATGTVNFNGKLHLNAQLAINEKIRGQLFKPIRENFQPSSEAGYSAVDFQVGGTLERPRTNLVDQIVGRDLKDIVSGFLGGKKSEKAKKKKRAEMALPDATASPVQSPASEAEETSSPTP